MSCSHWHRQPGRSGLKMALPCPGARRPPVQAARSMALPHPCTMAGDGQAPKPSLGKVLFSLPYSDCAGKVLEALEPTRGCVLLGQG